MAGFFTRLILRCSSSLVGSRERSSSPDASHLLKGFEGEEQESWTAEGREREGEWGVDEAQMVREERTENAEEPQSAEPRKQDPPIVKGAKSLHQGRHTV